MLSIAAMTGGQESYYLDLAREDYYLEGGEPPGQWYGRGAEALGLRGTVEKEALGSALAGKGPRGISLGQVQSYSDGRVRQPGWDLTFSAPKSVSVLWSQCDRRTRELIQAAHAHAVREALGYLEDSAAVSRRGKGGETVDRAGLLIALFEHGTSRAQDPQLHTHSVVVNASLREDGSWGAVRSRDFYQHKMTAGALYRSELAHQLRDRLGLALVQERAWFEIADVPKVLIERFSTRRTEIEAALAEHGRSGAQASEFFAKTTREVKAHVAREGLFATWQGIGEGLGFGMSEASRLTRSGVGHPTDPQSLDQAVARATTDLLGSQSYFSERDLLRKTAELSQAEGFTIRDLRGAVRQTLEQSPELVSLGHPKDEALFTTKEMLAVEASILARAAATSESQAHLVRKGIAERVLVDRPTMTGEQKEALDYLLQSSGSIQCVSGMAGTGKTYLLDAAREAWERQGFTVLGCSLAARAALQLEKDAHIPSVSIAKFLYQLDPPGDVFAKHHAKQLTRAAQGKPTYAWEKPKLGPKTVVVVDEAGMVGTRDMEKLISSVLGAGGKIVLVGDERQLQPINAGGPFAALREKFGGVELKDITRQNEEWMREAVRQFADGDARGALTQYALAERLHVESNRASAIERLIEHWHEQRTPDLSETLILAGTNADVTGLNELAQSTRLKHGEIEHKGAIRVRSGTFHEGDRVRFTENDRSLGVLNGDQGTIETVRPGGLLSSPTILVRLDRSQQEGKREMPLRVTIPLTDDASVRLGYATTVHKAQGATVDRAFVLSGSWMDDRELAYVQMSRSRDLTRIYVSDAEAGEDLSELARCMSQSHSKRLAHTIQDQQRQAIRM